MQHPFNQFPFNLGRLASVHIIMSEENKEEKPSKPLDETDIQVMMRYGRGPYAMKIQETEGDIKKLGEEIKSLSGIRESDTGLAPPSYWDLEGDKMMMQMGQPLQVARCTKIIDPGTEEAKYMISMRQMAKFAVGLGERVAATDVEEGMRQN